VLGRSSIASLQVDGTFERGYLAKPYRYVPLFSSAVASLVPRGASVDRVNQLRLDPRPNDQVPNERDRAALTARFAHRWSTSTLRLEERVYADDWALLASTSDVRYLFDAGRRWMFWPHLRFHVQSGVSFWQRAYIGELGPSGAWMIPTYRTGDRELGPLHTISLGAGAKFRLGNDARTRFSLVLEADTGLTRYLDALFVSNRQSIVSTLAFEAELD